MLDGECKPLNSREVAELPRQMLSDEHLISDWLLPAEDGLGLFLLGLNIVVQFGGKVLLKKNKFVLKSNALFGTCFIYRDRSAQSEELDGQSLEPTFHYEQEKQHEDDVNSQDDQVNVDA